MKVSLDVTPLAGPRTGIGHFVAELVDALAGLDAGLELLPYTLGLRARPGTRGIPAGARRLPVPAGAAVGWWGRHDRPSLRRWLGPADVLHGTNFVAPPARLPRVLTVHDCAFVRFPELCSPAARRYEGVVRRAVAAGAWVHTPSVFVAEEVRELFGTDRVRAVPHGVPRLGPPGAPPAGTGARTVAWLGALEPRKAPEVLVQAFGHVGASRPDVHLVLAGPDGPARPAVDAALGTLEPGVATRVHVLGAVGDTVRAALLHRAAVLAFPTRYEGFGFPVLEAMAAGTPVVTTAAGAVPEVAGDAALITDLEPDALADAIGRVLDDEGLRASLVDAGHRNAARFRWDACAAAMAALYREAAG